MQKTDGMNEQGAKRPPSPPSPALRPDHLPAPRSIHLQNLYARQQEASLTAGRDPFDAPVPNETYPPPENAGDARAQGQGQGSPGDEEEEEEGDEDEDDEEEAE